MPGIRGRQCRCTEPLTPDATAKVTGRDRSRRTDAEPCGSRGHACDARVEIQANHSGAMLKKEFRTGATDTRSRSRHQSDSPVNGGRVPFPSLACSRSQYSTSKMSSAGSAR